MCRVFFPLEFDEGRLVRLAQETEWVAARTVALSHLGCAQVEVLDHEASFVVEVQEDTPEPE